MKFAISLIILILGLINLAIGQITEEGKSVHKYHLIGLRGGLTQIKDEELVPRVHSGFISGISYEFRKVKSNYRDIRFTLGLSSLFMKPRDLAKFGQLLLNNGSWNESQIVDSAWVAQATRPLVTSDNNGASYGYYFWIYPAYQGYAAVGHGGQKILVVPPKNLVIIYTAWPFTSDVLFGDFAELADLVIRSCR